MYKRLGVLAVAIFLVSSVAHAAPGSHDATGADDIFALLGQEKPEDWAAWTRAERHAYLQGMGVYPDGHKYRGVVSDFSGYFAWLGVEEPAEWRSMSVEERAVFVAAAQAPEPNGSEHSSSYALYFVLLIVGVLGGAGMMCLAYRTD